MNTACPEMELWIHSDFMGGANLHFRLSFETLDVRPAASSQHSLRDEVDVDKQSSMTETRLQIDLTRFRG